MERHFDLMRKKIGLVAGPGVGLILLLLPLPLSDPAQKMAAIMACVILYWITEPIPIPVTALIGPMLAVLFGLAPSKAILASFGEPPIFLFIGSFLIACAMERHHLDRRIAISILSIRWVGNSPYRILWILGGLTALISLWISNTAATAMLFPIALGILGAMQQEDKMPSSYGTGMMLMIAFAASVGGIGTPIGTPPNLIGIGMIRDLTGKQFHFLEWMMLAMPIVVVMYVALYGLLVVLHPPKTDGTMGSFIADQKRNLPPWSRGEKNVLFVFGVAIFFWTLPGVIDLIWGADASPAKWMKGHLPEEVVAILSSSLLFFLPTDRSKHEYTLSWEEAASIDWGTILLFGGGLALGGLMFKTGLSDAIGKGLLSSLSIHSVWGITLFSIILAVFTSELTSNTASANMIIPVVIAFAQAAGVSPIPPALGAIMGASYGFMLPVSTPPNAIVYGSGLVPIAKMIRAGVLFDLIGIAIIFVGLRILSPLFQ